MDFRPKIIIDPRAFAHNLMIARQSAPNSLIMAVIKANAYGHGLIVAAEALKQADAFAVARIGEAVTLRKAGFQQKIMVLEGANNVFEVNQAVQYQLILVLHQIEQLYLIKKPLPIWLKVDTGMHRLGFSPNNITRALQICLENANLQLQGVLTHLANADDPQDSTSDQQIALFDQLISADLTASIANSAGILAWKQSHRDWNRAGIMLYGANPLIHQQQNFNLKPVMTFKSRIIAIQDYQQGDKIGYGGHYQCQQATQIATIAVGYGDGYPRHAKNGTPILIRQQYCPLVGRVSMDMIMVDISLLKSVNIGESVILWGAGLPVELIAHASNTISYDLFCGITERVIRENHDND